MDPDALRRLLDYLHEYITVSEDDIHIQGCDGTLHRTVRWLRATDRDVAENIVWLARHVAPCDCGVLFSIPRHCSASEVRQRFQL